MKIKFEKGSIREDFHLAIGFNWGEIDVYRLYFCLGLWYINICFCFHTPETILPVESITPTEFKKMSDIAENSAKSRMAQELGVRPEDVVIRDVLPEVWPEYTTAVEE